MTRGQIEVMLMDWGVFRMMKRITLLEKEVAIITRALLAVNNELHELQKHR